MRVASALALLASSSSSSPEFTFDVATVGGFRGHRDAAAPAHRPPPRPTIAAGGSSAAPRPPSFLTEMQLQEAVVPARNLRVLAGELRGTGPIPEVVNDTTPTYRLNRRQKFWINNDDTNEAFPDRCDAGLCQ